MSVEINGVAHIQLSVADFPAAVAFYRRLLPFLGLKPLLDTPEYFYCIGGRTGVAISPASPEHRGESFAQRRPGLHHLCFRARERVDVDELHRFLIEIGATIVHAPQEDGWAPGYYSVLFEDPDGIRLELNHVPGRGHLPNL